MSLRRLGAVLLFIQLLAACAVRPPGVAMTADLTTIAERSGYRITGRYEEVGPLAAAFQQRFSSSIDAANS